MMIFSSVLILSACGTEKPSSEQGSVNDGETNNSNKALEHSAEKNDSEDKKIGFNMSGETIEEAQNVPEDEKEKITTILDEYIQTFNDKDIEAYMNTLSTQTESFNLDEERTYMLETFERYDVDREIANTTITEFEENEAHVFTNMITELADLETKDSVTLTGRQVTVLTKDDGEWKIASVHYVGDDPTE